MASKKPKISSTSQTSSSYQNGNIPYTKPPKVDPHHWQYYLDNREALRNRGVNSGRQVFLSNLRQFDTQERFDALGWDGILTINGLVQIENVREFYAGYQYVRSDDQEYVHFIMYGKYYRFTFLQLANIFEISPDGDKIWFENCNDYGILKNHVSKFTLFAELIRPELDPTTLSRIITSDLKWPHRFWAFIVSANIIPKMGEREQVKPLKAYLIYCLSKGIRVDVLHIILRKMEGFDKSPHHLPFGLLLNRLFRHIRLEPGNTVTPTKPLDHTSFTRSDTAQFKAAHKRQAQGEPFRGRNEVINIGYVNIKQELEPQMETPEQPHRGEEPAPMWFRSYEERQKARYDSLYHYVRRKFEENDARWEARDARWNTLMERINHYYPLPPPPPQ